MDTTVTIVECRKFPGRDPFVRAFIPVDSETPMFETSVKKNSPNAVWNELFDVRATVSRMRLACLDNRGGSETFIANCMLDLSAEGETSFPVLGGTLLVRVTRAKGGNAGVRRSISAHGASFEEPATATANGGVSGPKITVSVHRIIASGGLDLTEGIVRVIYAGSTLSEFAICHRPTSFQVEPVGGHLGCMLQCWRVVGADTEPVASVTVDLRCSGLQCLRSESTAGVLEVDVGVEMSASDYLCCIIGVYPSGDNATQSSLHSATWSLSTKSFTTRTIRNEGDFWCGVISAFDSDATVCIDGTAFGTARLLWQQPESSIVRNDRIVGKLRMEWFSNVELPAFHPPLLTAPLAGVTTRGARPGWCHLSLTVRSALLLDVFATLWSCEPPLLHVVCGTIFSEVIAPPLSAPLTSVNHTLRVALDEANQTVLFSCWAGSAFVHAEFSPFHHESSGGAWLQLKHEGVVVGLIEANWDSTFSARERAPVKRRAPWRCVEFEVAEARGLPTTDLGGETNYRCVCQLLPLGDAARLLSSSTVCGTTNPTWNYHASLALEEEIDGIIFSVMDSDSSGEVCVGVVELGLESFVWRSQSGESWLPLQGTDAQGALRIRWTFSEGLQNFKGVCDVLKGQCSLQLRDLEIVGVPKESSCLKGSILAGSFIGQFVNGDTVDIPVQSVAEVLHSTRTVVVRVELGELGAFTAEMQVDDFDLTSSTRVIPLTHNDAVKSPSILALSFSARLVVAAREATLWQKPKSGVSMATLRFVQTRGLTFDHPVNVDLVVGSVKSAISRTTVAVPPFADIWLDFPVSFSEDPNLPVLIELMEGTRKVCLGTLVLATMGQQQGSTWIPLVNDTGVAGVLHVLYEHNYCAIQPLPSDAGCSLTLDVIRGRVAIRKPDSVFPSIQVVVGILGETFVTKASQQSLNPMFNESFTACFDNATALQHHSLVRIQAIDKITLECLGMARVSIDTILSDTPHWVGLSADGESEETVSVLLKASASFPIPPQTKPALATAKSRPTRVRFRLEGAAGLFTCEARRNVCEPLARICCLDYHGDTIFQAESRAAVGVRCFWAEDFVLPFLDGATVKIFLFDSTDMFFLGSCSLKLREESDQVHTVELENCNPQGEESLELSQLSRGAKLGCITLRTNMRDVQEHPALSEARCILVDVAPQFVRVGNSTVTGSGTLTFEYTTQNQCVCTSAFAVGAPSNSTGGRFRPLSTRVCIVNPSVVRASFADSSGQTVATGSFVVSHSDASQPVSEIWASLMDASSPAVETGKLLATLSVIADGELSHFARDTALVTLEELVGVATSVPTLLYFTVHPTTSLSHRTRRFHAPALRGGASSSRLLSGRSFSPRIYNDVARLDDEWRVTVRLHASRAGGDVCVGEAMLKARPSQNVWLELFEPSRRSAAGIGYVRCSVAVERNWLTGNAFTAVRFLSDNPVALGEAPEVRFHLKALDGTMSSEGFQCKIHKTPSSDSCALFVMRPVILPPSAEAVTHVELYSCHSGQRNFIGTTKPFEGSVDVLWHVRDVATKVIQFYDNGVPCSHSLVLSNAAVPPTDTRGAFSCAVAAKLTLRGEGFGCAPTYVKLQLRDRVVWESGVCRCHQSADGGSEILFDKDSAAVHWRSVRDFTHNPLCCTVQVQHQAISFRVPASTFKSLDDALVLPVVDQSGFLHGKLQIAYMLSFTPSLQSRRSLRLRDAKAPIETHHSDLPLVLQAVHVRDVKPNLSKHLIEVQRDGASVAVWERYDALDERRQGVELSARDISSGRISVTVWSLVNSIAKSVALIGRATVTNSSVASANKRGFCDVELHHRDGSPNGTIRLRFVDRDVFKDEQLNDAPCALLELSEWFLLATELPHNTMLTVRERDNPNVFSTSRLADLSSGSFLSVGPLSTTRCVLEWFISHAGSSELVSEIVAVNLSDVFRVAGDTHIAKSSLVISDSKKASVIARGEVKILVSADDHHPPAAAPSRPLVAPPPETIEEQSMHRASTEDVRSGAEVSRLRPCTIINVRDALRSFTGHKCAVMKNDKVVFIGGNSGFNTASQSWFDGVRLAWTARDTRVPDALARDGHAVAKIGETLFVDGGCGKGGLDVSLTSIAGTYEDLHAVYTITRDSAASRAGGGAAGTAETLSIGDVSSVTKATSLQNDTRQGAARLPQSVEVLGYLDTTYQCDTQTNKWTRLPTRGSAKDLRSDHSLVAVSDSLLLAFGGFSMKILETTELLDDKENGVSLGAELVSHRRKPKRKRTYMAREVLCSDLRSLNVDTREWRTIQPTVDTAIERLSVGVRCVASPPPTAGHTCDVLDRQMILFGGLVPTGQEKGDETDPTMCAPTNSVYLLDLDAVRWLLCDTSLAGDVPCARFGHASAVTANHTVLYFGGQGAVFLPRDDLFWEFSPRLLKFERILLHESVPLTPRFRACLAFMQPLADEVGVVVVCGGTHVAPLASDVSAGLPISRLRCMSGGDIAPRIPCSNTLVMLIDGL